MGWTGRAPAPNLDDKGAIVLREKIARGRIAARLANLPPSRPAIGRFSGASASAAIGIYAH
jgi:hypothetical protein